MLLSMAAIGEVNKSPKGHSIQWKIDDFLSLFKEVDEVKEYFSPVFFLASEAWCFKLVLFTGEEDDKRDAVLLSLDKITSGPPISIRLEATLGFKTTGEEQCHQQLYYTTCVFEKKECLFGAIFPLQISRLSDYVFSIVLKNPEDASADCTSSSPEVLHQNKVLRDFKQLYLKKEDCDVLIKIKDQEFRAHKAILITRSPVFESTFRNEMKEKARGIVDIEDCDPSSFSDFLCFLYCGDVEIISGENVFSLFTTADKYDVQDLRAKCLEFIKESISVDTFCDTITLALRHSETELIQSTTDFFTKNAPRIIVTVKWQSFLAENPTQSNELLIKLLAPNKCSNM